MIEYLEWYAAEYAASQGDVLVAPRPQNQPPAANADALVLHLTARYLRKRGIGAGSLCDSSGPR